MGEANRQREADAAQQRAAEGLATGWVKAADQNMVGAIVSRLRGLEEADAILVVAAVLADVQLKHGFAERPTILQALGFTAELMRPVILPTVEIDQAALEVAEIAGHG